MVTAVMLAASGQASSGGECTVMHDNFDVSVQVLLFVVAFGVLVAKWWREEDRRDWEVFVLDSSKQGVGFGSCHFVNMTMSLMQNSQDGSLSECTWYLVNVVLDCTVRVAIAYYLMKAVLGYIRDHNLDSQRHLEFGYYGQPPGLQHWYKQTLLWLCIVVASRIVLAVLVWLLSGTISFVASLVFFPTEIFGRHVQLLLVMVVVPLILNIAQLQVQDNFLQEPKEARNHHYTRLP
eukprot:TRINITY_DN2472_c1_g2_i1.p1 TRINITY_DN2472_c1_g2~~TRINITY_DN2472_c1_g2_i1.p1  ORF type:complete len:235 (+),score=39.93 TRINITY_DN2472_c1_g2_i1:55-759(+)